jgi:hypothetical protein
VWLERRTPARQADLGRSGAWPMICWAWVTGRLPVDLDLMLAKRQGDLDALWAAAHPRGRRSGRRLRRHAGLEPELDPAGQQVNRRNRRVLGCARSDRITTSGWNSDDYSVHPAVIGRLVEVIAGLHRVPGAARLCTLRLSDRWSCRVRSSIGSSAAPRS